MTAEASGPAADALAVDDATQLEAIRQNPLPRHVAIIMDGNGRWAGLRGLPRVAGHREGVRAARETVRAAGRARHRVPDPLRVLLRELDPAGGRGELSHAAPRELRRGGATQPGREQRPAADPRRARERRRRRAAQRRAGHPRDRGEHGAHAPDRPQLWRPPGAGPGRAGARGQRRGGLARPGGHRRGRHRGRPRHRRRSGPRPPDPDERRVPAVQLSPLAGRVHGAPGPARPSGPISPPAISTARSPSTSAALADSGACRRPPGRRVLSSPCSRSGS